MLLLNHHMYGLLQNVWGTSPVITGVVVIVLSGIAILLQNAFTLPLSSCI